MTDAFQTASIASNKAVTLSFWVNADYQLDNNLGTPDWNAMFEAFTDAGFTTNTSTSTEVNSVARAFDIRTNTSSHAWFTDYEYHNTWNSNPAFISNNTWITSGWHHIAYVLANDNGSTHLNFYIDGTLNTNVDLAQDGSGTLWANLSNITSYVIGGCASQWADGDVAFGYDDIAIYDEALTAEQVETIIMRKNKIVSIEKYDLQTLAIGGYTLTWGAGSTSVDNAGVVSGAEKENETVSFNDRFAIRIHSNAWTWGRKPNTQVGGFYVAKNNPEVGIRNLKSGEKVTITFAEGTLSVKNADKLSYNGNNLTASEVLASGREYDVIADGELVLTPSAVGLYISNVVIKAVESVTAPTITDEATGIAHLTPTIVNGICNNTEASVKTYYTSSQTNSPATDGTEWTGEGPLPTAGTYYFYSVSSNGVVSEPTTFLAGYYEVYDFQNWYSSEVSLSLTEEEQYNSVWTGSGTLYTAINAYDNHNMFRRFAFQNISQWSISTSGLGVSSQNTQMAIRDLKAGDKVIVYRGSGNPRVRKDESNYGDWVSNGTILSAEKNGDILIENRYNGYTYYTKFVIISQNYSITEPSISFNVGTGSSDVTVTPGVLRDTYGNATGSTTTYITTDGTTPTTNSSTELTFSLTEESTVKAVTIYEGGSSPVASELVAVSTPTLNAPTASAVGIAAHNGKYYRTYNITSNQESVAGRPTGIIYSVEFSTDDFATSTKTSLGEGVTTYAFEAVGKARFYSTKDGYNESAASDVVETVEYVKTSEISLANYAVDTEHAIVNGKGDIYGAVNGLNINLNQNDKYVRVFSNSYGLRMFSDYASATLSFSNFLDGQIGFLSWYDGSTTHLGYGDTYSWSRGNSSNSDESASTRALASAAVYTPTSLIATSADAPDFSGKVIYAGNVEAIAAATSTSNATTITLGNIGNGVTVADLNSMIPSNEAFVKLPANSWYEYRIGANIKKNDNTITSYVLNDAKDYTVTSAFTPTVGATYNRVFTENVVSTICLPFAIGAETAATLGKFYELKNTTTTAKVVFTEVSETAALKPYLFEPAATGTITIPDNTKFEAVGDITTQTYGNVTFK